MVLYSVRFDGGKVFTCTPSFEKAKEIKKRKSAILLDELNSMLVELLKQ